MLSTSLMQGDDLMSLANATNSGYVSTTWTKPKYKDDGAVHIYTVNWHPDYIEILCDGVRIQFQAYN